MKIDYDLWIPVQGNPGVRRDPETGETGFSSAWLGDFAGETPLTEALAIVTGLATHPRSVEYGLTAGGKLEVADPEGAQVIALQARSRPVDGDIGPGGARGRSEARDPSGRHRAPPEAFVADERGTLRRFIAQSMGATVRHMDRLLELESDPLEQQILRGRRRQLETLLAMFEDDPA